MMTAPSANAAHGDGADRPLPSPERIQDLLYDAARLGRVDVLPALVAAGANIDVRDARGFTPLILASYNGQAEATDLLLSLGAQVDAADSARGNTALMGVAFKGHVEIAAALIAAGAVIDARNRAGQTALMMAALFGHTVIVDQLSAAGADVRAIDVAGNSALSVATAQHNEHMVRQLSAAIMS